MSFPIAKLDLKKLAPGIPGCILSPLALQGANSLYPLHHHHKLHDFLSGSTANVVSVAVGWFCTQLFFGAVNRVLSKADEDSQRDSLLKRVKENWIDQTLHTQLYKKGRIDIQLRRDLRFIRRSNEGYARTDEVEPVDLEPRPDALWEAFESNRQLLLVGQPGSGKSTLLLELVQRLHENAVLDKHAPIPAVFTLCTWGLGRLRQVSSLLRPSLEDWMISELDRAETIDKEMVRDWFAQNRIVPILDGLDELESDYVKECLEAIDEYIRTHRNPAIAIGCRKKEYIALRHKFVLSDAIEVVELTPDAVQNYIKKFENTTQLASYIALDSTFLSALNTPYLVWLAYRSYGDNDRSAKQSLRSLSLETLDTETRRERYQAQMQKDFAEERLWRSNISTVWLRNLSRAVIKNRRTIFFQEDMNEKWVGNWVSVSLTAILIIISNTILCTGIASLIWVIHDLHKQFALNSQASLYQIWAHYRQPFDHITNPYSHEHTLDNIREGGFKIEVQRV